jgi:hypothetical protein
MLAMPPHRSEHLVSEPATTCVSVGPSPAAGKPRGIPLRFILQLEAAAARVRWPTGQPPNGYLAKRCVVSKASQHCQSGSPAAYSGTIKSESSAGF